MRQAGNFRAGNPFTLENILSFLRRKEVFMFMNSNKERQLHEDPHSSFDWVVAAGATAEITAGENACESWKAFYEKHKDWLFGVLSYDLKNDIEQLHSENYDGIQAPLLHFFTPEFLLQCKNGFVEAWTNKEALMPFDISSHSSTNTFNIPELKQRTTREQYIADVNKIKEHIHRGDIYEMNYCMEFYAENVLTDPFRIYAALSEVSPTPFSCFYRNRNIYLISASPERYLRKRGNTVISQPMKGTIKRGADDSEDAALQKHLKNDPKEQSENVMIVDLVRNDLSRHAVKGTVKVDELFGTYTFPQVHQMISTVSCKLKPETHFIDVIRDTFPMGSMTGAPKVSAMQLIEQYERTKRGLYSGAIGYITPEGDFDFNVVIRSILYNSERKYLSFMVGSAITATSDAAKEYEECLLKAKAMTQTLEVSYA